MQTETAISVRGIKRQVVKHSSAIQIGSNTGDISLIQRKAFNVLLAYAYDDLPKKDEHKIPIMDLCRYINFDSNNTRHLKDALRGLVKTNVEWNILGADRQQEWGVAALLAEVRIKNGFCYWGYSSTLRKLLYNPRIYARINLSLQNQITSKHSLILYENIFFYYREGDGFGETPWIDINTLRKLLGIPEGRYKQFKVLNGMVIKKSIHEINDKTELIVTIEYKRSGREVSAVKFFVKLRPDENQHQKETPIGDLENRLVTVYGISKDQAKTIVKKYNTIQITENLAVVDEDLKNGKVNGNLAGYTVSAIKNDYRRDRRPVQRAVPVYEGMQVIFKGQQYTVDSALTICLENGTIIPSGGIIERIKTGMIRVLELLLFPGMKLIINGKIRTIKNASGEPVIKDSDLFLSEKELKAGIKSRDYIIFEYPQMDLSDDDFSLSHD